MKSWLFILSAGLVLLFSWTQADAKDLGLEVAKIPRGTVAHYIDSDGRRFTETYKGKLGTNFIVQLSGSRNATLIYNANGFLTKRRANGYFDIVYRPFYCSRKLGKCQFAYDTEFSKYSGRWNGNLRKTKDGYAFDIASVNKNRGSLGTIFYKFGKYNIITEYVAGSSWYRLEKLAIAK